MSYTSSMRIVFLSSATQPAMLRGLIAIVNSRESNLHESFWLVLKRSWLRVMSPDPSTM